MEGVKVKRIKSGSDLETVSIDDTLKMLENNRNRLRDLNNMVLTVCGLLISASFVVIFFTIQNSSSNVSIYVPILFFGSVISQILSIIYSIFSSMMPQPSAVRTRFELIDAFTKIYHREYRRSVISVVFLILAIAIFVAGLIVFAITSL